MAYTEYFEGRPRNTAALIVGGGAEDPRAAPNEVGMIGVAIDIPHAEHAVREPDPPCETRQDHELLIGIATIAEFAAGGATIIHAAQMILNPGPGLIAETLRDVFGAYRAQCILLSVRIPDGFTMTRIQTTVSTNDHPAAGAIFKVDPTVGHIQQYHSDIQGYRNIPDVLPSHCASYSGAPPALGIDCSFGKPVFHNARGEAVHPEHPSKVTASVVFKNWSSELDRTPLLRVYYR